MQIERQRKAKEKACKEKAEKQKAEIVGRIRLRQGFRRDKGSRAERPERKNTNRKASIRVLCFLVVQNPRPSPSGIAAAPGHRRPRFGSGWLPPGRGHAPQSQRTPPHGLCILPLECIPSPLARYMPKLEWK